MEGVTYTTTTVVFQSDSTTIDSLVQQTVPVGVDDDGEPVVFYNDYGTIGYTEPAPVDKPLRPELSFERSSGTYSFDENMLAYVSGLTISWEPALSPVDYYKVFCVIDSSNGAVLSDDLNNGGDAISGYTMGPLFQYQSEKILPNIKFYTVDLSEFRYANRINVFVFAYNSLGRSDFPQYMLTFRGKDKSGNLLARMYSEKTTYLPRDEPHDPLMYLYFIDDSLSKPETSNVLDKELSYY